MSNQISTMEWISKSLSEPNPVVVKITSEQYLEWKKQWVFDALKDYRLGQSFCEYFGISNASPLYYFRDNNFSNVWIHDNYLQQ